MNPPTPGHLLLIQQLIQVAIQNRQGLEPWLLSGAKVCKNSFEWIYPK